MCAATVRAQDDDAGTTGVAAMLIDATLQTEAVRVLSLDEDRLIVADERGRRMELSVEGILALLPASGELPDPSHGIGAVSPNAAADAVPVDALRARMRGEQQGVIELIDGQRLPGSPSTTTGEAESVQWSHPKLGEFVLPLERIARIINPDASPALRLMLERDPVEDVVHLSNGDRLSGFVVSYANPVQIETDQDVVEVPSERVVAAVFANPRERIAGLIVWLEDGTVTTAETVRSPAGASVEIGLSGGQDAVYEIAELRAIGFDSGRLLALSDLDPVEQAPIGERRLAPPIQRINHPDDVLTGSAATLDALDVILPGPMRVVYEPPRIARRFATTASLAPGAAPWGDCELVILADDVELFRQRLYNEAPTIAVNLPLEGRPRTLTIMVEPGNNGPIRDRVILHRPLILLDNQPQ
ncbi:MAG: hypothetical protein AAFX05_02055 [Planctomycetota bacterium]